MSQEGAVSPGQGGREEEQQLQLGWAPVLVPGCSHSLGMGEGLHCLDSSIKSNKP